MSKFLESKGGQVLQDLFGWFVVLPLVAAWHAAPLLVAIALWQWL